MKKIILLMLALVLIVSLCACNQNPNPTNPSNPDTKPSDSQPNDPNNPDTNPSGSHPSDPTQATMTAEEAVALIQTMIGQDVSKLYEIFDYPIISEYAPSCLNPGEGGDDGMLVYSGFVVYTYRTEDAESIQDVEAIQ